MSLLRWRPMRDLVDIQEEINCMFQDIGEPTEGDSRISKLYPPADVLENKDSFIVRAELPGMKKEDVKVTLQNNVLVISGEKKREEEQKDQNVHKVERSYGTFYRTFELPVTVNSKNIQAEFKEGVLTLELPKVEEAKPKEITINVK
jgi:HSP20 family protein